MKMTVTFEVDESKLAELETTFDNELGWLADSGITVVKTAVETKLINNPVVLAKEIGGEVTEIAFEKEFVESWLRDLTNGQETLEDFLGNYTSDDTEALELEVKLNQAIKNAK